MADNTQSINTLHQLLDYDARKFTSAEIQLKKSLEDWINKAGSMQLKIVLQKYHAFVQQHVLKMDSFFEELSNKGFPAVHHSKEYESEYKPAYRVIDLQYLPFLTNNIGEKHD